MNKKANNRYANLFKKVLVILFSVVLALTSLTVFNANDVKADDPEKYDLTVKCDTVNNEEGEFSFGIRFFYDNSQQTSDNTITLKVAFESSFSGNPLTFPSDPSSYEWINGRITYKLFKGTDAETGELIEETKPFPEEGWTYDYENNNFTYVFDNIEEDVDYVVQYPNIGNELVLRINGETDDYIVLDLYDYATGEDTNARNAVSGDVVYYTHKVDGVKDIAVPNKNHFIDSFMDYFDVFKLYKVHADDEDIIPYYPDELPEGVYDNYGYYGFYLLNDESVTFKNIPSDVNYEVWEFNTDYEKAKIGDVTDRSFVLKSKDNDSGKMSSDIVATFLNERTYSLEIKKNTINNLSGGFDFRIKIWNEIENPSGTEIKYFDLSKQGFENGENEGEYKFSLSNKESKKINNIPFNSQYEVWEVDENNNKVSLNGWIDSEWKLIKEVNTTGTVDSDKTVYFTNKKNVSNLRVRKVTIGEGTETFRFKIKASKDTDTGIKQYYDFSISDNLENIGNNEYAFNLSSGDVKVFENIPDGFEYEVYEIDENNRVINVGDSPNDEWKLVSVENNTGVLNDNTTVTFKNLKSAKLTVKKKTIGDVPETFDFVVKFDKHVVLDNDKLTPRRTFDDVKGIYACEPGRFEYYDLFYNDDNYIKLTKEGATESDYPDNTWTIESTMFDVADVERVVHDGDREFAVYLKDGTFYRSLNSGMNSYGVGTQTLTYHYIGSYSFKLSNNEEITIDDIPYGYNYDAYEVNYYNARATVGRVVKGKWNLQSQENEKGKLEDETTATFTNRYALSDITVKKETVDNKPGEFDFTVYLDKFLDDSWDASSELLEIANVSFNEPFCMIEFRIPENITLLSVKSKGTDTAFTKFSENRWGTNNYEITDVTIEYKDKNDFVYERKLSDITPGNYSSIISQFNSELKRYVFNLETGAFKTFKLNNGSSYLIKDIPYGTQYKIVEAEKEGWELKNKTNDSGTTNSNNKTSTFTNDIATYDIKVTKETVNDVEGTFNFGLTLMDDNYNPIANETFGTGTSAITTDENGAIKFSLKNGESKTITDLPYKINYYVYELNSDDEEISIGQAIDDTDWVLKSITGDYWGNMTEDKEVTFTNEMMYDLTIKKETVNNDEGTFRFVVKAYEDVDKAYIADTNYTVSYHKRNTGGVYIYGDKGKFPTIRWTEQEAASNDIKELMESGSDDVSLINNYYRINSQPSLLVDKSVVEYNGEVYLIMYTGEPDRPQNPWYSFSFYKLNETDKKYLDLTKAGLFTTDIDYEYLLYLNNGEEFEISDLPNGCHYEVYEIDSNNKKLSTGDIFDEEWQLLSVNGDEGTIDSDKTATFKNQRIMFTITYDLNGGEYNGSTDDIFQRHQKDEVIKIHEAPTRKGYKFLYWKGSEYYPGQDYTVVKDHTLTAQWARETSPSTSKYVTPKTGIE